MKVRYTADPTYLYLIAKRASVSVTGGELDVLTENGFTQAMQRFKV